LQSADRKVGVGVSIAPSRADPFARSMELYRAHWRLRRCNTDKAGANQHPGSRRITMQRHLLALATATALVLAAPIMALAQSQAPPADTPPAVAPAPRTVNLTQEQRFIIKEIVTKDMKVQEAKAGAPEAIGDQVPQSVELHDMPPLLAEKVPQAKSHKFFVTSDAIVLVSPSDRRVADVIKM
jgi:hypothetical protein